MEDHIINLIRSAQAGNEEAFAELFRAYYHSAYVKASHICLNEADAKDAVQESFYEVHHSIHKLRDPSKFYSWLMMIVMSKSNLQYRRYRHLASNEVDDMYNNYEENRAYMDPLKYADDKSEREILLSIIDSLTDKQAEIVKMMYLREMKLSEIAKELNIPLGTVKTRLSRAKEELRKSIEEYEQTENRKLNFHVDMLLPSSLLGASFFSMMTSTIKQKVSQVITYSTHHATMSVCAVSLSTLAVTGTVFVYEDYQAAKGSAPSPVVQQAAPPQHPSPESSVPQLAFSPISYAEDEITTIRDAYFACMNFAQNEEVMKQRTEAEYKEILPLYEQLKNSNSPYYQQLVTEGWTSLFESYAYTMAD